MIKISIIVPIFNTEKYLERCIDSIINQTYKNFEVILVDDGSSDSSGDICDKYAKKDDRIKVFHQKNAGQQAARKKGVNEASGDYICFVDSDDFIDLKMLEKIMMLNHNYDLLCFGIKQIDSNNNIVRVMTDKLPEGLYSSNEEKKFVLNNFIYYSNDDISGTGIYNSMASKIFKADIVKSIMRRRIKYIRIGEDFQFLLLFLIQAKSIFIIHDSYYYYYMNSNSVMHRKYNNYLLDQNVLFNFFIKETKKCINKEIMFKKFTERFMDEIINLTPKFYGFDFSLPYCQYIYPKTVELKGKKVVIYGAGKVGQSYYKLFKAIIPDSVVSWVDIKDNSQKNIFPVSKILEVNYDYIVIAVLKKELYMSIKESLVNDYSVDKQKILWRSPIKLDCVH